MIILCPYCGHQLLRPLLNGMSSCNNCCRVFDSSNKNVILSTYWLVKKRNILDRQYLIDHYNIPEDDADFVVDVAINHQYSYEEFVRILNQKTNLVNKKAS